MVYEMNFRNIQKKRYTPLGKHFQGENPQGEKLSFTNYYMTIDGKPFFGISGEFHFSRCDESRWEDEIIKMRMCGVNIISTYVFWIHHEEEEGVFDFSGSKNLRKFVQLCQKHHMCVILRIGPFNHGEVRNGGLPDWLYGKSFEVRKLNEGFLFYTRRIYLEIARQIEGLLYREGGSVIAAQIDNEYMHSSAVWEITTGISEEWIFGGDDGEAYMLALRDLAKECGIDTPFYTCTGWGGAITPSEMMPLWGGYSYRPWLFYTARGEHPVTEEYIYQDYHNNEATVTSDFKPAYQPEERPYACCEMGGGMMCTYNYRFVFPFKGVDAMANIKLASGCNFLGYYVFQGGSNPKGKTGVFMNEAQTPKISYDYQAPLGEFGQIRESYQRLKAHHYFALAFGKELCEMQTVLPEGASLIDPKDLDTLRFAVRTDGKRGFLFLNNFQDHVKTKAKEKETVILHMEKEDIMFSNIGLAPDENCVLPFHMNLGGIDLVMATAQPVTVIRPGEKSGKGFERGPVFVFLKPEGMDAVFRFEEGTVTDQGENQYDCASGREAEVFHVKKGTVEAEEITVEILCLSRTLADQMYLLQNETLIFSQGAVLEDERGIRLESVSAKNRVLTYPKGAVELDAILMRDEGEEIFDVWSCDMEEREIPVTVRQTARFKYEITFPDNFMEGLKDALLQVNYSGDIGYAFLEGDMISDNFCNHNTWEIGLRTFADRLDKRPLTLSITPWREGVNVNVESAMAARMEEVQTYTASLERMSVCPVYEKKILGYQKNLLYAHREKIADFGENH